MSSKRMTANPLKPARYRPGKAVAEENSSDDDNEGVQDEDQRSQAPARAPPPKATSFPSDTAKIASNLNKIDLNKRRRLEESAKQAAEKAVQINEDEFVTEESESADSEEASDSGEGSESEDSSSEDEAPKKLLRPTFIKKGQRKEASTIKPAQDEDQVWVEEEARQKAKADAVIQEQLEKDAAARAAGKKEWDEDEAQEIEDVDDKDDLDPETERAAWKLRELKRIKRDREAIEEAEKQREEIERRRNLSKEEREAEDQEFLDKQKEDRDGKGKIGYMQKYFHKGAFFQDGAKAAGLDQRDIMGSRFQDDIQRDNLPKYMQIRDMTKLGKKGRTRYKDLKTEDTGRWGAYDDRRRPKVDDAVDDIFKPDRGLSRGDASGANTTKVGERRRPPKGAPEDPRADIHTSKRDSYATTVHSRQEDDGRVVYPRREQSYSRTTSPPRRRRRSESRSRSPPRRRKRDFDSKSRSRSPARRSHQQHRDERKRSPLPSRDREHDYKRRRLEYARN